MSAANLKDAENNLMRMDEYDGKQFLATVRGEDFAHAGETESIDFVFQQLQPQRSWNVLDIGCGRGGTAHYVNEQGWGQVVGVDIDEPSIEYAQAKFPQLKFVVGAMETVGTQFPQQFDLIYSFNVFYASNDKRAAMASFRKAAKPGAMLCIFDYIYHRPEGALPEVFLGQRPATDEEFTTFAQEASWQIEKNENLDAKYIEWYSRFLAKFDDPALSRGYSKEVIDGVRAKYAELLASIESGTLGGVLFLARAH
jgi:Methylase involved in ubiquinone/menaquinone biosynthesis